MKVDNLLPTMAFRPRGPLAALLALLALALVGGSVAAVDIKTGNLLITDRTADPFGEGDERGILMLADEGSAVPLKLVAAPDGFVDPVASVILGDSRIVVVDANADAVGDGQARGCLWLVDPSETIPGTASRYATDNTWENPVDVLMEPSGNLLVLDADADPLGLGTRPGALYRVDAITRAVRLIAASVFWVEPRSMVFDRDGKVLVWDGRADPLGLGRVPGALFRVDPVTGIIDVVFSMHEFATPWALALDKAGNYLILDRDANPAGHPGAPGAVFRVNRSDLSVQAVLAPADFIEPVDILTDPRGDVWVLDQRANPYNYATAQGALFRCDLTTGTIKKTLASGFFRSVSSITQFAGTALDSSRVSWEDLSGSPLQPGDRVHVRVEIRNTGPLVGDPVEMSHTIGGAWDYITGTATASEGTVFHVPGARLLHWSGAIDPGASVTLEYDLRLRDNTPAGARTIERILLRVARAASEFELNDTVVRRSSAGRIVWADYQTFAGASQGMLMEQLPGQLRPTQIFRGPPLTQPDDVAFLGDGRIAILDRRSRPHGPDQPAGGVYVFDPYSATLDTVLTVRDHPELRYPVGLASGSAGEVFLIDKDANPLNLPGQPGAVFRLDTATGRLRLVASSRLFSEPADALLESSGTLLIVDYDADPSGNQPRAGSLFEVDPETGSVRPIPHPDGTFVDPIGIAEADGRRIMIADLSANPLGLGRNTGAVFELRRTQGNTLSVLVADSMLADPTDVVVRADGSLLITDREGNPYDLPPRDRGAVYKYTEASGLEIFSADAGLYGPEAIDGYDLAKVSFRAVGVTDLNGPPSSAGDTLRFNASFSNAGIAYAHGALSTIHLSEKLDLIDADGEGVSTDPHAGIASWFGDLAPRSVASFRVRAAIGGDLTFGEKVHATLRVSAPGAPPTLDSAVVRVVAPLRVGDIAIADRSADPARTGSDGGALFLARTQSSKLEHVLMADTTWIDPIAVEGFEAGKFLVADDRGTGEGRVYVADYITGESQLYIDDERLGTPADLMRSTNGDLYIVDQAAHLNPGDPTATPAIFRLPAGGGPLALFSSEPQFRQPEQIVEDDEGRLWVADKRADVNGSATGRGAIFRLDPTSGAVIDTIFDGRFVAPVGLFQWVGEGLILLDALAAGIGGGRGAMFFAQPDSGTVRILARDSRFRQLEGGGFTASGELWIVDRIAKDETKPDDPRTLFRWDPETNIIDKVAASTWLSAPVDLCAIPGPNPRIVSYESEDLNGLPLRAGDRVEIRTTVKNFGPVPTLNAAYTDTIPGPFQLDAASIQASTGIVQTQEQAGVIVWNLDLQPGESHSILYQGVVRSNLPQGIVLRYRAHLRTAEGVHRVKELRGRLPVYYQDNYMYSVDGDSDPFGLGGSPGAIWKTNLSTGLTVPMGSSTRMSQPVSTVAMPTVEPTILVVDAAANPTGHPRARGAIWKWMEDTGGMSLVAADSTFRSPRAAVPLNDHQILLLDTLADPLGYDPSLGPGAIYVVDVPSGRVEVFASDSTFATPRDLLLDGRGGLWIADADADPADYGLRNGAIYRMDLFTREVTVYATSADFRGPSALCVGLDGSLYVLDRDVAIDPRSDARGAIFRVERSGNVSLFANSSKFRRPMDLYMDQYGRVIVSDADADPLRTGKKVGAIFRREGVVGEFQTFVSGPRFNKFGGFFVREALTPIEIAGLAAHAGEDGIEIVWDVPTARFEAFFVLRAEGEDPPARDYVLLNESVPVSGDGPFRFLDGTAIPGTVYAYLLRARDPGGLVHTYGPVSATALAPRFGLLPPAPNPASGPTALRFALPGTGVASIDIYDIGGRRVRSLLSEMRRAGRHVVRWDGRDDRGHEVTSGLYLVRLSWSGKAESRRIVYIR